MRARPLALAVIPLVPILLLLTACGPGTPPKPADTTAPTAAPVDEPTAAPEIPDNAVLALHATATASNGAILDVDLIVGTPEPYSSDGATPAWDATTAWCTGEVDDAVISGGGYSFTTVDVVAIARAGTADWPDDTPLLVLPLPSSGSTITAVGDLRQVNEPTQFGETAGSIPHCAQPVLLDGAGTGSIYVGIAGDVAGDDYGTVPFGGWANRKYGLNANQPGDNPPVAVTFSDCTAQITEAGGGLGAPTASWQERFQSDLCVVGGDSVGQDAG